MYPHVISCDKLAAIPNICKWVKTDSTCTKHAHARAD